MASSKKAAPNGKGTTFSLEPALSKRSAPKGAATVRENSGLQPLGVAAACQLSTSLQDSV
jgi:hypothetical protein